MPNPIKALRWALADLAEGAVRGAADIGGREAELPLKSGGRVNLKIGPGYLGLAPKDVAWDMFIPEDETKRAAVDAAERSWEQGWNGPDADKLRVALDDAYDAYRTQNSLDTKRAGLAVFRAAEQGVRNDMNKRSPFALWSPLSGYSFYGATDTHDKIYEGMLRRNKHPDYYAQIEQTSPYSDYKVFYLRRKFPLRHEIAAAAAAGVLFPNDAGDGDSDTPRGPFRDNSYSHPQSADAVALRSALRDRLSGSGE